MMQKYNGFNVTRAGAYAAPALIVALALAALLPGCAHDTPARHPKARMAAPEPAAAAGRRAQDAVGPAHAPALQDELRRRAPPRYVVKRGDTLWDIAGYYLRDPWYWPQLWDANPRIANPHRIYPGEVLVLSRGADGRPRLRRDHTVRLSPRIREQPLEQAIPTIPRAAIQAFITGPRLVTADQIEHAPYIVSFADQHLIGGAGTGIYVRGAQPGGADDYSVVRAAGAYRDPDTGEKLGAKALPIGQAHISEFDRVSTGTLTHSNREALTGDRLLPIEAENLVHDFYPHAPAQPVKARIISVYGGLADVGQYQIVTLNRGRANGVERGLVLTAYDAARTVADPVAGTAVRLPPRRAARLLVFKAEKRVCFALIMRSQRAIHVGDIVRSP